MACTPHHPSVSVLHFLDRDARSLIQLNASRAISLTELYVTFTFSYDHGFQSRDQTTLYSLRNAK